VLPPDFVEPPPLEATAPIPVAFAAPAGGPPPPATGPPPPGVYDERVVGPPGPPGPPFEEPPAVRALWPWLLLLAILVIGGLVIAWALTRDHHHKTRTVVVTQSVRVPDVRGRAQADAVAAVERAGLQAVVDRRASSRTAGTVIDERPAPGTSLARGSSVTLIVSAGKRAPATVRVPDVVGLTATKAVKTLSKAGLRPQTKTAFSQKPNDTVLGESPAAGSSVVKGSVVTLTVSKGRERVAVPNVVGSSQSAAVATLRLAGLVAKASRVASAEPAGTVVAQDPKAGEQVVKGSRVRINVARAATTTARTTTSTTPVTTVATTTVATTVTAATTTTPATTTARPPSRTVSVPDVVGQTQTQARQALRRAGLRWAVAYVHANLPFDQVVAQYPKPDATLKTGTKVRINVSLGPKPKPQRTVPDVTSQDEATAAQQLRAAGFKVETFDEDTTDPSADGVVLDQDPAADTQAPVGSIVTIYVGRYNSG
jgi:beta-lactam-binding protein with PASTA domain